MNQQRRTFAIISHPDAGKTTITEKFLLFAGAIEMAGAVKGKKSSLSARSDWMELEKQRGISVTTSVMQFVYRDCLFNLLDTPGHSDFSEDTYRTLTAVDSALMVIDAVKGVEERTKKLMQICRSRSIPVITFINKLDRGSKSPLELLDEIESELGLLCQPVTWPVGMGRDFLGVYQFTTNNFKIYESGKNFLKQEPIVADEEYVKSHTDHFTFSQFKEEVELLSCDTKLDRESYLHGDLTPIYFGSALNNFGIKEILDGFVDYAPMPQSRELSNGTIITPESEEFTAFVFKVQANMDLAHRDRVAFCRICSGTYQKGQKIFHVQGEKFIQNSQAVSFLAQDRKQVETAYPGDIIGLINHGSIGIGDTFCTKKRTEFKFKGIPRFAPEIFKIVRSKDPLKMKQLTQGLVQLTQEGATSYFKKIIGGELILGAIGVLQFDVVAYRLEHEYQVPCEYIQSPYVVAKWFDSDFKDELDRFVSAHEGQIAADSKGKKIFLATSKVQLNLTTDRWKKINFYSFQED